MQQPIIVSVDIVLLTLRQGALHLVLLQREQEPYAQQWALPGGYVRPEEDRDALAAAQRVLRQKTGLVSPWLEQLYTFSGGVRDPRGWSLSIAWFALVHVDALLASLPPDDGQRFSLLPVDALPDLPFDHGRIAQHALQRLRAKSAYSALPAQLLPPQFTLSELQQAYEVVLAAPLDKSVFRRRLNELDFLEAIPGAMRTGQHRPAQLYRLKAEQALAVFDKAL